MPTDVLVYLGFLGLLALMRLLELWVSKRNQARLGDTVQRVVDPVFPWMVTLHTSFFVLVPLELIICSGRFGGPLPLAALIVTVLAFGLRVWTLTTMGRSWNVHVVHSPDAPVIHGGPYRYIRHPNYLVVFLELLFIPLIMGLWASALVLTLANIMVLRRRIATEEAALMENPAWVAHMSQKPRFFFKL